MATSRVEDIGKIGVRQNDYLFAYHVTTYVVQVASDELRNAECREPG